MFESAMRSTADVRRRCRAMGGRPLAYAAAAEIFALVSSGPRGSDTQTTVPVPSFERNRIDPPCSLVSERAIASPSPEP